MHPIYSILEILNFPRNIKFNKTVFGHINSLVSPKSKSPHSQKITEDLMKRFSCLRHDESMY